MLILLTFIFLGLTIIFWLSNAYIADTICAWICVICAVCCLAIEKKIELEDLKWWIYVGGDDESCQCEECQETSSASTSKKQEETTQKQFQQKCNHQWIYLEKFNGFYVTIYCPKCKSEQNIKNKEWKKMQIDKEYQEKTEGSKN